jgi:hypothetical protein
MSTILSHPERGPWGKSNWRGNCSGHVYADLFRQIKPAFFIDPMVGSGTSIEVAAEMGIESVGLDLHSGFNILRDSIIETTKREADLCVSHPPYGGMILYSGAVWGKEAHPDDLSRCASDEDFHCKMQVALLNQREATKAGGLYGTIIGDYRRQGRYTSYQAECIARMPSDELAAVIIKAQHNVMSSSKTYKAMQLPMISHEYIVLWRKPRSMMSFLSTLSTVAREQHARMSGTWIAIVKTALMAAGRKASLSELYEVVAKGAPDKLASNPNWRAKVRQVVNSHPEVFRSEERGVWELAAA